VNVDTEAGLLTIARADTPDFDAVTNMTREGGDGPLKQRLVIAVGMLVAMLQLSFARASADTPLIIRNVRIFDGEKLIDGNASQAYSSAANPNGPRGSNPSPSIAQSAGSEIP